MGEAREDPAKVVVSYRYPIFDWVSVVWGVLFTLGGLGFLSSRGLLILATTRKMTTSSYEVPVLDTYHAVVLAFTDFLTVSIHTILYERDIYPRTSFLSARKYNFPVKQSRHPSVSKWIQDAVAAVEVEMLKVR